MKEALAEEKSRLLEEEKAAMLEMATPFIDAVAATETESERPPQLSDELSDLLSSDDGKQEVAPEPEPSPSSQRGRLPTEPADAQPGRQLEPEPELEPQSEQKSPQSTSPQSVFFGHGRGRASIIYPSECADLLLTATAV